MTAPRRGVALTPMETRRDVILRTARLADQLGYETFSLPEGWGLDSATVLTEIALLTRRIKLVSGVFSIWSRTPATLAMTAATLHQISDGRFVLGLGASTRALTEGFHDVPFEDPAGKLRNVTAKVRALLAGERAGLDHTPGAKPLRLGQPPAPDVPIWLAAMGPRAVKVAVEMGDGWFPVLVARDHLASWAPQLNRQRQTAGQTRPLTIAAGPMTVVADEAAAARDIAASSVAWYLCAMGDVYARFVSGQGYGADVQAILDANPHPSPQRGIVPDEAQGLLDQLTAYGTGDQVRDQLEVWHKTADIVMIGIPPGLPWQNIEASLHAAAPTASLSLAVS
jgi:alkanesulfonate monooxygenase SsuD/methylene tetrahydromethanopterin reductase-like flavin-dependent oxidoreductase (luciferase family)